MAALDRRRGGRRSPRPRLPGTIPVVVLTTSLATHDIQDSYAKQANGYVTKPINLDEFLETIRAIAGFWFETATLPSLRRDTSYLR